MPLVNAEIVTLPCASVIAEASALAVAPSGDVVAVKLTTMFAIGYEPTVPTSCSCNVWFTVALISSEGWAAQDMLTKGKIWISNGRKMFGNEGYRAVAWQVTSGTP